MEKNNTPTHQEEVDLGKLFQVIGNGFSKLFKAISNLFKSIFHYFILLLIFFKKHAIILGIATLVGGILGYVLDINREAIYQSSMITEMNFGSGHEVYKQKDLLNSFLKNKEYKKVATIFNITEEEAKMIKGFSANPYDIDKNLLLEYDYYMQHTDTIYTREFTIEDFKKRYSNSDYRKQEITVYGYDKNIFPKLNNHFKDILENDHYKELLTLKTTELDNRRKILIKDLQTIDSIRKRYEKVEFLNAKKNNTSGTNISLSEKLSNRNKDVDLFTTANQLLSRLKKVENEKIRNGYIVSVLSEFKEGNIYDPLIKKKWLRFALLFGLVAIVFILGKKVNTYLNNYTTT